MKLYQGKTEPTTYHVGTERTGYRRKRKDKFGELERGEQRACFINTKWGQLYVPLSWMGRRIRIEVKEVRS